MDDDLRGGEDVLGDPEEQVSAPVDDDPVAADAAGTEPRVADADAPDHRGREVVDPAWDPEAVAAAEAAGLVYVDDTGPGHTRVRRGTGFGYRTHDGSWIQGEERDRIVDLVIPPAWTDVWISADPDGHVQATGRDDADRKQYRYHDQWRAARDAAKFARLVEFPDALAVVRDEVDAGLRQRSSARRRVLALVIALLDETLVRVGNEAYARDNETFGLTTLRDDHVEYSSTTIAFDFVGKGGIQRELAVTNRRLARAIAACAEVPGQHLFAWRDEDGATTHRVDSGDVNEWLRTTTDQDWTAKDFRLWGGTVAAASALADLEPEPHDDLDRLVLVGFDAASEVLGNTRDVARSSYVHPAVASAFRAGELPERFARARARRQLRREESAVARLLVDHAGT